MSRRRPASKQQMRLGKLTREEKSDRVDAYEEPPGHPQGTVHRMMPDSRHIRELRMLFEAAGVLPYLERRLRRSGPESRLTVLALLIALFYVAGEWNTYWRTYVACFFASLPPQDAVDLGVQPLDSLLKPVSYDVVCTQARRLEEALSEGWTDEDGTDCNLRWFTASLIEASVPPRIARQIEAVAMDATDVPSWAKWRRPDEQGRHGLDPDATRSHRSANSERESGLFYGYFLTPCIAVKARRRTRSTKKAKFGDDVPAYAVSMIFRTAAASVADSGLDAMGEALKLCPNISEVVADRGYTQLGPTFNRDIHRINIDITMDYKAPMLTSAKPVRLGPSKYPAFFHAGTFLHAFTPPNWRVPPAGLKGNKLKEFYTERAKRFGLVANQNLPDGAKQFSSPVRDGRLNIDPDRRSALGGQPLYLPPPDLNEIFGDVPDEIFHQGLINATVEELDYHQSPPFGTPIHDQCYGRRNPSENIFSQTKDANGLSKKLNRTMGIAPRHIMCLARCIWYNLKRTRQSEKKLKDEKRKRRAANKTRPKTHTPERQNNPDHPESSQTHSETPDSPARPPPPT